MPNDILSGGNGTTDAIVMILSIFLSHKEPTSFFYLPLNLVEPEFLLFLGGMPRTELTTSGAYHDPWTSLGL